MDRVADCRADVIHLFRNWKGYAGFSRVMDEIPELDVYLAGGAVRDVFLDRKTAPKDFDFFLRGVPLDPVLSILRQSGRIGFGPFGSPRWYPDPKSDDYCDVISIVRFTNGLWPCEDIIDVLNQFDFTANAMAFDLRGGVFFDPQNGTRDLRLRVLRAVRFDLPDEPCVPGISFGPLALLWFRLVHYSFALGLALEPLTLRWVREHRDYRRFHERFAATFFEPHPAAFAAIGD